MDEDTVRRIGAEAGKEAARQVLLSLGINAFNPIEAQETFSTMRELATDETREDLAWVRRVRGATETVRDTSLKTVTRILVTAFLGIVLLGTKEWWWKHISG